MGSNPTSIRDVFLWSWCAASASLFPESQFTNAAMPKSRCQLVSLDATSNSNRGWKQ